MSNDARFNYWKESLECTLDEEGLFGVIPDDKINAIVKSLILSSECEHMSYAPVENPLSYEVSELKKKLQCQKDEFEKKETFYRQSVATRRKVNLSQVYLDESGDVMISPS